MRSKWFGIFGIILALTLMAGPLASGAFAAGEHEDPHAGHDMNTMSEPSQTNEHDMNNMEDMSHDSSASGHEGNTGGDHGSQDGSHESSGSSHDSSGSGHDASGSSHDSGGSGGHDSGSGGHGGAPQDPNTPPNWPVIYGFGAFNSLVILAAALLKNKGLKGVN